MVDNGEHGMPIPESARTNEAQSSQRATHRLKTPGFLRNTVVQNELAYQPLGMGKRIHIRKQVDANHAVRLRVSTEQGDRLLYVARGKDSLEAFLMDPDKELLQEDERELVEMSGRNITHDLFVGSLLTIRRKVPRIGVGKVITFGGKKERAMKVRVEAGAVVDLSEKPQQRVIENPLPLVLERSFGWRRERIDGLEGEQWEMWEKKYLAQFVLTPHGRKYFAQNPTALRELIALRREDISANPSTNNDYWERLGGGNEGVALRLREQSLVAKVFNDPWNRGDYYQGERYARDYARRYEQIRRQVDMRAPSFIKTPRLYGFYTWDIRHVNNTSKRPRDVYPSGYESVANRASEVFLYPYLPGVSTMQLADLAAKNGITNYQRLEDLTASIEKNPITYDDGSQQVTIDRQMWERIIAAEKFASQLLEEADKHLGSLRDSFDRNIHDGHPDRSDHAQFDRIVDFSHPTADSPFTLWMPDPLVYSWKTIERRSPEGPIF